MNDYYPMIDSENFQEKLLEHSEFNELIQSVLNISKLDANEKLSVIKARLLNNSIILKPYQEFVARFISSYTPYESLLIFHSPGSGKTLSLLNILKNNIDYFVNQNSFIYIFVPRKLLKMQWIESINKHFPELNNYIIITTYKSLYNKVVGERKNIIDIKSMKQRKMHTSLKTDFSEYEHSIIVLEEAHNVTNNNYTLAINKLRENVKNKKILCLTATPIKNLIDEIIDIFNFLVKGRTLIKTDYFNYINGKPILKDRNKLIKDITGYVSTLNINDSPYLARKIEIGEYIKGLEYVKICKVKCPDKYKAIMNKILEKKNDSLGKVFESISNIIFPYVEIGHTSTKIVPIYGNRGYDMVVEALKIDKKKYNSILSSILNINEMNLFSLVNEEKLSGKIFTMKYIRMISPKMWFVCKLIENLSGNIFIYSSYKKIFIELLGELLINEGYSDYRSPDRGNESQKKCYICNKIKSKHVSLAHEWQPICFFIVDSNDINLIDTIKKFNSSMNMDGRYIKIIMASVMVNEGISIHNCLHSILVDGQMTMSRKGQIERRVIRLDSHDDYIIRNNIIPDVYVYNLALYNDKDPKSIEIDMYKLAESKYKHVLDIYKILQEASIDVGVYTATKPYKGKSINTTRSLVKKENRIDNVIKYITIIFNSSHIMEYNILMDELKTKFNEISIMISLKYLIDNEKLFIVTMKDIIYIFSNLIKVVESVDTKFLNIHNYYSLKNDQIKDEYYYDLEYINTKKMYDVCGIVSNKFKLKFTNSFIDKIGLDIVKSKNNSNLMKGWICNQSINKYNMTLLINYFKLGDEDMLSKDVCDLIYKILYDMEKYSDDNYQYLIYPKNYQSIPSILNIHDRYTITCIQYESKGFKIEDRKKIDLKSTVNIGRKTYNKISYRFNCIKEKQDVITVTIE